MPPSSPRPAHRYPDSPSAIVPDDHPRSTSRIVASVRRTLSTAKRRDNLPPTNPMYSTVAERNPYNPSRFRFDAHGPAAARPTVEQIAMGLHLSRTPHLRAPPKYPAPASHPQSARPTVPLPPPPARSSLKKPALVPPSAFLPAASTSSTTDVTSTAPSTPRSSDRSRESLRTRVARFLPHRGLGTAHDPAASARSSPRTSTSDLGVPRKKAVRFVQADDN
ncbi:hypothetical protein B0H15DRAFT_557546 [Mycena belliarum]|uniref:Uncharacterized protein n=1 Tax=Mycena belliarum TaxID=1033014 RepID=A0AAD6XIY6_9AGAR|nr:hypothetical protein B0H15DRAFT_557546 [Mycena belliae]